MQQGHPHCLQRSKVRSSSFSAGKGLRGLARNPMTLRALVSTGIDFNRALRSLRGCRSFLLGSQGLVAADL